MALKTNSKKILDIIASQPKQNATAAYKEVHTTASDVTARTNAHQLLKKPDAQIYLQQHISKAKNRIVELVDSEKENIALQASEAILNRELGTPTKRLEVQQTGLNISIDLTTAYQELDNITEVEQQ